MEKITYKPMVPMGNGRSFSFLWPTLPKEIPRQRTYKPLVWKRFIADVFLLWNITKDEVDDLIERADKFHPTIKFTAEISGKEITFLNTNVYKGQRFYKESLPSLLDVRTYYKPTETFQYTICYSCHSPGVTVKRFYQRGSTQASYNKLL